MRVPIEQRVVKRVRASDFFSYSGFLRNVVSERLAYVAILKELIDNALDAEPTSVSVALKETADTFTVTVQNDGRPFPRRAIQRTFSSYEFFSSAKFWKLPSRGTLGNALKVVSGAPAALSEKSGYPRPKILMVIKTRDGSYEILAADDPADTSPAIHRVGDGIGDCTSITMRLPRHDSVLHQDASKYYRDMLMPAYFLFNPNVEFRAQAEFHADILNWRKRLKPVGTPMHYGGLSSVHWYGKGEFKRLMRDLAESTSAYGTIAIHDFLGRLRGFSSPSSQRSVLRSTKLDGYSFKRIAENETLSEKLYDATKNATEPAGPEVLGFVGRDAIHDALKEIFGADKVQSFHYHRVQNVAMTGDYQVPYVIEVALAGILGSTLHQFYGINRSAFLLEHPNEPYHPDDPFEGVRWEWEVKTGRKDSAYSLAGFLEAFELKEREGAAVIVHITSPNLRIKDYAKSRYDFSPTGSDIAQAMYEVCRFYPKERIRQVGGTSSAVEYLKEELLRRQAVLREKNTIPPEEWTTQQALFYKIRTQMRGDIGIKRKSFIAAILKLCRQMGDGDSSYREKLGIKAAIRAQFFHRGQEHAVSFDSIERLSDKGSDLLLIEKEGVAEILEPYASQRGVAILNTRGFASEYAKQIMKVAEQKKGNIFILTDLDASGLAIAQNLPGFMRIGIDESMITHAGKFVKRRLERKDVEERYQPSLKHLKSLPEDERRQVAETRVEIDALLAAVGPKALWKSVETVITKRRTTRDLRRSMEPQVQLPEEIYSPWKKIETYAQRMGNALLERRIKPFQRWQAGLVTIKDKEKTIEESVRKSLSREPELRKVAPLLKKAADLLPDSE